MEPNQILCGDTRNVAKILPDQSVHCIVTSPPYYGLRNYKDDNQIGLEKTYQEYIKILVGIFRELHRVLRNDGTLWLNLGDSYAGSWGNYGRKNWTDKNIERKGYSNHATNTPPPTANLSLPPKNLIGIPWRVALALQNDGWILRSDIIWSKPNPTPESVQDRPTKSHEYIFLFVKQRKYYYDINAIREPIRKESKQKYKYEFWGERTSEWKGRERPGARSNTPGIKPVSDKRNKRSVWTLPTSSYPEAHFAVFPPALITPCILAGCPPNGIVLDPFMGSGTTAQVSIELGRKWLGIELNPEYIELAKKRIEAAQPALFAI